MSTESLDAPRPMATVTLADLEPVSLSLADRFRLTDATSAVEGGVEGGAVGDTFENVVNHGTEFYDVDGHPIEFSAGKDVSESSNDHRKGLQRTIDSLAYFEHNIFGKMSFKASDLGLASGNSVDATITDAVAEMIASGEFRVGF